MWVSTPYVSWSPPPSETIRGSKPVSVLGVLPPEEVTSLLQQRLGLLEAEIAGQRESLAQYNGEVPRLFLVEAEYDLAIREAEATWIRSLLDELTAGSLPGLAQWRAWYETGQRRSSGPTSP
jgi:hypothetical protein